MPAPTSASRVETFPIAIPQLEGRSRTIRVYLPPGYESGRNRYPVLYLQDGQSLFTAGLFGDWQADETLDRLARRDGRLAIIAVGIDNGERRWDEYGPWSNAGMHAWIAPEWARPAEGGDAPAYLDFLVNTLKPEIDRRYRTLPGREHTGIGGSSMGGLVSLYGGLVRPDVFSRVMAMSTAVWFAEDEGPWLSRNRLLGWMRTRPLPRDVRFYLDVGTEERSRDTDPDVRDRDGRPVTYPRAYLEGSQAAASALAAGGVPEENIRHVVEPGAIHHESAWGRRLEAALLWLYASEPVAARR
jgi:predicted alpha/beta superfamily hydrolase